MSLSSDLISIPAFLLFHLTWLAHAIHRPLFLVSALFIVSNPQAALYKLRLSYLTFLYLLFCKDKKWKPQDKDPASFFPVGLGGTLVPAVNKNANTYRSKTVILIRHGESTWNDTFNAGDRSKIKFVLFFLPNLLRAISMEVYYFIGGKSSESWFFDSPLSSKGVRQGEGLRRFLKKERMRLGSRTTNHSNGTTSKEDAAVRLLLALGEESDPQSHVVSSNLRRAISTAAIGLADRFAATISFNKSNDSIVLLPSLQEISKNPDALTILPPLAVARPTWCDDVGLPPGTFSSLVDTQYHTGNKPIGSNGLSRLHQFCADVFDDSKLPKNAVIAAGHSLFYRSIFQVFLPRQADHVSKKKKLVNGGTVMITLREATTKNGGKEYMIDPKSIVIVYGGFGKHIKG